MPQKQSRTLREVLKSYLDRNHLSDDAAYQHFVCLNTFKTWMGSEPRIDDLNFDTLRKFLRDFRDSGRSERTCNNKRQVLLMLWKFANRRGWIECPREDVIKEELPKMREAKRLPIAWTLPELKRLRNACKDAPKIPKFGPTLWDGRHWLATVLLIWDTGHRIEALLSAPRSAVDDRGFLRMDAEHTKTNREQVHELSQDTLQAVDDLPESKLLLPWPYKMRQLWIRYEKDILIPSGLPYDRKHKFHCLRKTSASHLCVATDEYTAMQHLGHSNVSVTRESYLDPTIAYGRQSAARVLPKFGG